jgi:hypothetical protein
MKPLRRSDRQLYRVYGEEEFMPGPGLDEWNTGLQDREQIEEAEAIDWREPLLDESPVEEGFTETPEASPSVAGLDGYRAPVGSGRGRVTGVVLLTAIAGAVIGIIVVRYLPSSNPGLAASTSSGPVDRRPVISTVGRKHRGAGVHLRRPLAVSEASRRIVESSSLRGFGRSGLRDAGSRTVVSSTDSSGVDAQKADSSSAFATQVADGAPSVAWHSGSEFGFER